MTTPNKQSKQFQEEGVMNSNMLNNNNYKDIMGYIFAPISQDELKYYCLIIFTVIGTTLTYFVPNLISTICISLISIILCMFIATFIWMWTVLPDYKRMQMIQRIQDVFKYGLHSYLEKTDNEKKNPVKHNF